MIVCLVQGCACVQSQPCMQPKRPSLHFFKFAHKRWNNRKRDCSQRSLLFKVSCLTLTQWKPAFYWLIHDFIGQTMAILRERETKTWILHTQKYFCLLWKKMNAKWRMYMTVIRMFYFICFVATRYSCRFTPEIDPWQMQGHGHFKSHCRNSAQESRTGEKQTSRKKVVLSRIFVGERS